MKDHLLDLAGREADLSARLNLMREYLQAHILRSLQDAGAFASWAFQGGTALRFLHGLRRFSEDLGFSRENAEGDRGLLACVQRARSDFEKSGYDVETTARTSRPVQQALVKFPGLLREAGLAALRAMKLVVRIDLDTRPPEGAVLETRLVTRHFPIVFRAHDLPSCMAGKIHALLARRYTKGRDLFDLAWYLTHPEGISPNCVLLRHALAQTGWEGPPVHERSWKKTLAARLRAIDWSAAVKDVEPFLEDRRDIRLLDRRLLLDLLRAPGRAGP